MNILRHFGVALASVMITACCCAQSLLASATGTGQNLAFSRNITGNFTPVTGVTAAESGDSTVSEQPPDAPSARQTEAGFEKAKPAFEAPNFEDTLTANANAYDSTSPAASTGKLVRMISGIMRRFDQTDLAIGQNIRGNAGLSGDTSFAISQHLALVGGYEHNSLLSSDTMAFGVAFTFGRNTN